MPPMPPMQPGDNMGSDSSEVLNIGNWVNGADVMPLDVKTLDVTCPGDGKVISRVVLSTKAEVDAAVAAAAKAYPSWSGITSKSRAQKLHRLFELIRDNADVLADCIVREHGKTKPEALAEVAKGNETVEYACSMQLLGRGNSMLVSRGVKCEDAKLPLGVVAHIVPFNFPAMVPLWTLPIAIACGNCVVVKPSEKVPQTMSIIARLAKEAGIPDGVINIVNGAREVVEAICDHPDIAAVTFVGSSGVAKIVADRCHVNNKRIVALGGAKNHLIALPDCEPDATTTDIVGSFTGCCGQRCMAASVLVVVDDSSNDKYTQDLLSKVVEKASALPAGQGKSEMGPMIDQAAVDRCVRYISEAEKRGVKVLLDGRSWCEREGFWLGPTVLLHPRGTTKADPCIRDEIFGPIISVIPVSNRTEAIELENSCEYGNAACVYTTSGANADWFTSRFTAAMIGVNIGVPVPREPFSFGGMGTSKFGDHGDITGDSAVEFFTRRRKVTTRWPVAGDTSNQPWFK